TSRLKKTGPATSLQARDRAAVNSAVLVLERTAAATVGIWLTASRQHRKVIPTRTLASTQPPPVNQRVKTTATNRTARAGSQKSILLIRQARRSSTPAWVALRTRAASTHLFKKAAR